MVVMEVVDASTARPVRRRMPEEVRLGKKALHQMIEQCQRTLELLRVADRDLGAGLTDDDDDDDDDGEQMMEKEEKDGKGVGSSESDFETEELYDLIKSKVESPDFLEKLGSIHASVLENSYDDNASWDMVSTADLWEDTYLNSENELDQDSFVLVRQEDVVEGIAGFMAAYLLSLKQTKELSPNKLQEALSKTFSVKKRKSRLLKAWDGSKVIYNVASWGATAVGIYQNPAIVKAATAAVWSSFGVISKLL
ncbi:uncharacterized protein LOC120281661 [Dioscorea cayenensis subsp. rotundata]|uniref:Uncharacterized protein LOC120281661 n=1 Tax=Dioscorea cayennensis subsp. rotundata TaxID=55577 RepID=A0AB40CW88_DIOCR|nr:uncharacterized protein LOC120281661 [Dioscorea cayenensis subsp. rotundata]